MSLLFPKGPEAPAPVQPQLWVMPNTIDGLTAEIAALTAAEELELDRGERTNLKTKRQQCEAELALMQHPSYGAKSNLTPGCGIREWNILLERVRKFGMEDAWLAHRVEQYNGTPESFNQACYKHIADDLTQLEAASKKVNAEKKREKKKQTIKELWEWPGPLAPVGMKAVPTTEGRYNHVTTTEEEYQVEGFCHELDQQATKKRIEEWAAKFPLSPEEIAEAWRVVDGKTNARGRQPTTTKYCMWQARMQHLAKMKYANGRKPTQEEQTVTQQAPPAEKPKTLGLFAKKAESITQTTAQPAPEPAAPADAAQTSQSSEPATPVVGQNATPATMQSGHTYQISEELWNEIAEELGIKPGFVIDDKEKADWVLKKRNVLALELAYITNRYNEISTKISNAFTGIDERFKDQLEAWAANNLRNGKKTINLLYGDLAFQNRQESFSLDDEDLLQAWIHGQEESTKEKIGAKLITRYTRNLDAIKPIAAQAMKDAKPIPGLKYTAANPKAFYIRPSIDTVKENIKKGKIK